MAQDRGRGGAQAQGNPEPGLGLAVGQSSVGALSAVGLDPGALDVYRLMLRDPSLGPEELAGHLSIGLGDVHAALDRLAQQALLGPSSTAPHQVRPVSPEVALRRLVVSAETDLRRRQGEIDALREEVEALVDAYRRDREERFSRQIELLSSQDAVVGAIEELTQQARHEVLSFMTGQPSVEAVDEARERDEQSLKRGMKMRVIYLEGQVTKAFVANSRRYHDLGTEIRMSPTLPMQMLIYDQNAVVTSIDPQDPSAGAMVVRAPGLVVAMTALFELQWAASRSPYDEQESGAGTDISSDRPSGRAPADQEDLSQLEKATLVLLAKGHKDDALARSLGISVRSARRIVAGLSERVDAKSRFELAVRATHRGWL